MKLKEFVQMIGLRRGAKVYGHRVQSFELPREGQLHFAQWNHPRARPSAFTQAGVDQLRELLSPGDTAVDIGAHLGDTALPMALACGTEGCVLALEPNPYVFRVLEANAALNRDKTNIVPLNLAATLEDGPIVFEYSDAGYCNGGRHEGISKWRHGHAYELEVEGRFLPSLLEQRFPERIERIRLIKVDAEGYDASVLESVAELIARTRPFVIAEVFKKTDRAQRERLYDAIAGHGYDLFKVEGDEQLRGPRVQRADLMRWPHFDVLGVPR